MKKKYKILCVSDIDILSNMNIESMKNKFRDIDFIISAGDVSNKYIDFLNTQYQLYLFKYTHYNK